MTRSPGTPRWRVLSLIILLPLLLPPGLARARPRFAASVRLFEVTQPASQMHPGGVVHVVPAVEQNQSARSFYDYRSASSHTGWEKAKRSIIFLHRDLRDDTLSLLITHGIDNMGQPASQRQPSAAVNFDLQGVPQGARVTQSDDNSSEFGLGHNPEGR